MGSDISDRPNVSESVLNTFKKHDDGARVVSVLRDACGRSVVRMRSSQNHNSISLLRLMQNAMPLAKASVIENSLDGTIETEVVVPTRADERAAALRKAAETTTATAMKLLAHTLFWSGVAMWAASLWK